MLPFVPGAAASAIESGASLVATHLHNGGVVPTFASLGAVAGDLLIALNTSGGALSINGNTGLFSGIGTLTYSCVLQSGQLSYGLASNGGTFSYAIYRGAASATRMVADTASSGFTNRSAAGFVKSSTHCGLVATSIGSAGTTLSLSMPAIFAVRHYYQNSVGGVVQNLFADRLQPLNPYYANGDPFIWSSTGSGNSFLDIFELRTI